MRILVTGGCGYVGTRLVPELLKLGYEVHVMDWMMYGNYLPFNRDLHCYKLDLRDFDIVNKKMESIRPDTVIDLASISNDPMGNLNPKLTKNVNVVAQYNLIKSCEKNNVYHFIFASSSSVYGENDDPNIDEKTPLSPISLYSRTKMEIEQILGIHKDKIRSTIVRPATVCGYSPRQRLDLIVNLFVHNAYTKGKISVEGGHRVRPHVHIDDMVNLYVLLVEKGYKTFDKVYNCGGETMSLLDLAKKVQKYIPCEITETVAEDNRSHRLNSDFVQKDLVFGFNKTVDDAISDLMYAFDNSMFDLNDSRLFNMKWYKHLVESGEIKV